VCLIGIDIYLFNVGSIWLSVVYESKRWQLIFEKAWN